VKKSSAPEDSETLDGYDFSRGVRGKYAERHAAGSNVVVHSPDVAESFPDSQSVNQALRALVRIARQQAKEEPTSD
jgi:hypothetical protein